MEVLADGISRALKPIRVCHGLFGREHFNEAFRKRVETVSVDDVVIEGGRIELRQHENFLQSGVEAVTDGDIDQPVLSPKRYSRFRPVLRERE